MLWPERGGTVLECAIVLPLLLLIILALIDFSRYLSVRAVLESGADRAMAMASTINGLDEDPQAPDSKFASALTKVKQEALRIPLSTFLSDKDHPSLQTIIGEPEVILPSYVPGSGAKQKFENDPITIRLSARLIPIFPLVPAVTVQSEAIGYRETHSGVSLPIPVDCEGRPLGDPNYFSSCNCPSGSRYIKEERRCVTCPKDYGWDLATHSCKACPGWMTTDDDSFVYGSQVGIPLGCRCPGMNYCRQKMGTPYGLGYNIWCDCRCWTDAGWNWWDGNACTCADPKASIVPHTGKFASWNLYECQCIGANTTTQAMCDGQYGAGVAAPNSSGCGCHCSNWCGSRANAPTLPSCGCTCWDPENQEYVAAAGGCVCKNRDVPCANVDFERDQNTCGCTACKKTCKQGTLDSAACVCRCSPSTNEDADGNCPTGGPNTGKE